MVTKFENIDNKDSCPAKESGILLNDIILSVNGKEIKSNEQLCEIITNSEGRELSFNIIRNNQLIKVKVKPIKHENNYKIGVWIRDSCAGMGTITYYDKTNSSYGALGHGIYDVDSGGLMYSDKIEILKAKITSVNKSSQGNIGTLNGYFTNDIVGNIGDNLPLGIYGKVFSIPNNKEFRVAKSNEVKLGKAYIYSTIISDKPEKFEILITDICNYDKNSNKNFLFKVNDKKLMNKTGGIVQGMSGSPIVQDDKIIGAITHVLINDPKMGYGIFIENMLNKQ